MDAIRSTAWDAAGAGRLECRTEQSESHSLTASLLVQQPGGMTLSYQYQSEPKLVTSPTMHPHRGTAVVKWKAKGELLEGEYYTGRGRQNYGTVRLWRVGREPSKATQ